MEKVNKAQAMWEFLSQYPELNNYLKFDSVNNEVGDVSFSASPSEKWKKQYMRGHGIKNYDFTVIMIIPHDTGTSSVNIEEYFNAEKFMEWISEQNEKKNFPIFGENERISSIETLQNSPNVAGVDADGASAKVMFGIRITYTV